MSRYSNVFRGVFLFRRYCFRVGYVFGGVLNEWTMNAFPRDIMLHLTLSEEVSFKKKNKTKIPTLGYHWGFFSRSLAFWGVFAESGKRKICLVASRRSFCSWVSCNLWVNPKETGKQKRVVEIYASGFCDLLQQLSIVASLGIAFKRILLGLISIEDCGCGEKEKKKNKKKRTRTRRRRRRLDRDVWSSWRVFTSWSPSD